MHIILRMRFPNEGVKTKHDSIINSIKCLTFCQQSHPKRAKIFNANAKYTLNDCAVALDTTLAEMVLLQIDCIIIVIK